MRAVVRCAMALVALAAAALSWQSLAHLGLLCGYGDLAPLYPVVVDAGAAASCSAWLHTRGRQPLAMTWGLLAISVVLNGTSHWLVDTHTAPGWLLVVAVASVPPVVLGLCVHLAVGLGTRERHTEGAEPAAVAPEQGAEGDTKGVNREVARARAGVIPQARPGTRTRGVNSRTRSRKVSPQDPELVASVARLMIENPDYGRPRIARELGLTSYAARTAMDRARELAGATNGHGSAHLSTQEPGQQ